MVRLDELTDGKGRLHYHQLVEYLLKCTITDFIDQAKHPLLVGRQLYDGELRPNVYSTKTMTFRVAEKKATLGAAELPPTAPASVQTAGNKESDISHAIYLLRKNAYSGEVDSNVITLGRSAKNDVVIADYTVSNNHAQIVIFHGKYFIVDCRTTNGTRVDGFQIPPNLKVKINVNAKITIGRFRFVFTSPYDLYQGLRKESFKLVK